MTGEGRGEQAAYRGSLRYYASLLGESKKVLFWAGGAVVFDTLLTLCRPWPLKVVIDRVIHGPDRPIRVPFVSAWLSDPSLDTRHVLYGACAATLLIATGTGYFTYVFTSKMGEVGRGFTFRLRRNLFAHMQRLSLQYHVKQQTGELTTRLLNDIRFMQAAVSNSAALFAGNVLLLLGMVAAMFWLDFRFALLALSLAPLLFVAVFHSTKRIVAATREARSSDGKLAALAQETLSSIRLVQGLAQEERQDRRFEARNRTSLRAYLTGVRYQARVAPLVDLCAGGGLALVMWYGAHGVLEGRLTTGDVLVFFAYVTNLYSPMRALSRLSMAFARAGVGAERVAEVLAVDSEVKDAEGAVPAPRFDGAVRLEGVSFSYGAGKPILRGIDLDVPAGQKLAIVGATGAGKSTLASLLPRLYDPTEGRVLIDGRDVREYRVASLREQIAFVLQEAVIFRGTIRENIEFGNDGATEQEIVRAAKIAQIHDFVISQPDGYDTVVGERGATLSGGQRQRVAIARAAVRNAPLLILDEPTSGLDVESERLVIDALERASQGRTTIVIAHRLCTLRFVDRIIVLDEGRIVEDGSHDDLLSRGGKYAKLHRLSSDWGDDSTELRSGAGAWASSSVV